MSELTTEFENETRLNPITIFYKLIVNLPGLIIPLYIALANNDRMEMLYIGIGALYGLLVLPSIILHYYYFTFFITPNELVIKSGIFARKQRNIPLSRVQNIEIEQNFLQRILGLARVKIETAGDSQSEGLFEFLSVRNAEHIRTVVNDFKNRIEIEDMENAEDTEYKPQPNFFKTKSRELFRLSAKNLLIHGMLRFRPVFFVAVFIFFQYINMIPGAFEEMDQNYIAHYLEHADPMLLIIYLIAGTLIMLFLSWLVDILLTFNKFFGFNIFLEGDKLLTEQGLLGKRKGSIPLKKLQFMAIVTNVIKRKFGYYGLELQTAGLGERKRTPESAVPIARLDKIIRLARDIKDFAYPDEFIKVSKKTIRRAMIRYLIALIPIAIASYFIFPGFLWAFILTPLLYFAAVLRFQYRGYHIQDSSIIIRQGFIYQRVSIIPIEKIQTMRVISSFFQRHLGLATINIDTAGTSSFKDASIIDIDIRDAEIILAEIDEAFRKAGSSVK